MRSIKLHYCDIKNFGDQLNRDIFLHYGYDVAHTSPNEAQVSAIGSILEKLSYNFNGLILGSGFMFESSSNCFPNASILGVRGHLTRKRVFASQTVTLGDPGLLAPNCYAESEKQYDLGLVPHYVDALDERLISLSKAESKNVLLIDVTRSPKEVIADITRCKAIASSSLHGLIIADAFGIPSIWMELSNKVSGKGFKFKDYYSAFGENPNCITGNEIISIKQVKSNTRKRSSKIYQIKEDLDLMFQDLHFLLNKHQDITQNFCIYRCHYFKRKLYSKFSRTISKTDVKI